MNDQRGMKVHVHTITHPYRLKDVLQARAFEYINARLSEGWQLVNMSYDIAIDSRASNSCVEVVMLCPKDLEIEDTTSEHIEYKASTE